MTLPPADQQLLRAIEAIRSAHPDMERLFTNGQCYAFHLFIRALRPAAEAWYSRIEGHVYSCLDGRLYDIRGERLVPPADVAPLCHRMGDRPHRWGLRDTRRFVLRE
jgi:hypothetical protein